MDRSASVTAATVEVGPVDRGARAAAALLLASGIVGGVSLAFLVGMFVAFAAGAQSAGMALGFVNDNLGWVTCLLALPAVGPSTSSSGVPRRRSTRPGRARARRVRGDRGARASSLVTGS